MTAKEYLKQIKKADAAIDHSQREADKLLAILTGGSGGIVKNKHYKKSYKSSDLKEKLADLNSKIEADIDRYVDLKREISVNVQLLEDGDYITLLTLRYFDFLEWNYIADRMGYSLKHVHKIHGRALQALSDILKLDTE